MVAKILFAPSVGREIGEFSLVKGELERNQNHTVLAIALDNSRMSLLAEAGFSPKHIADYQTKNMLNIIRKESPDIVVTDFCATPTISLIVAANYAGIPTLMIDCGIKRFDDSPITKAHRDQLPRKIIAWFRTEEKFHHIPFTFTTLLATSNPLQFPIRLVREILKFTQGLPSYIESLNMAVLSPSSKSSYVSEGVPPENVFVTGQLRFDLIWQKKFSRSQIMKELSVSEDVGIIVLATQPLVESYFWTEAERDEFTRVVVYALKEFSDKQLVIKLHPDEDMEVYQKILANIGEDKTIICQDIDIYELLNACELLMTAYSTVALEAMLFDKPVITLNLSGEPDFFPYAESGAAIGVYQKEELVPAIQKALYDPEVRNEMGRKRKEFVQEHAYIQDGQASKRVAELISRLIEESKRAESGTQ